MPVRGASLTLPLALLALLAVPAASAAEVAVRNPTAESPVTLYLHLRDQANDFPMSTEMPTEADLSGGGRLSTTNSLCLDGADPVTSLGSKQYHTYYGFSTPDSVLAAPQGSDVPYHRGMAGDVELGGGAATLQFFLAAEGGNPSVPTVVPDVVVRATLRSGSGISVDDEGYNSGEVLLQGQSNPAILAGEGTSGATYEPVDGRDVYGFQVPLQSMASHLNASEGYNLRVDVFVENPYCDEPDASVMPDIVFPFLDGGHLPRLELAARGPVQILAVVPSFLEHGVAVDVWAQSPWGPYDVGAAMANATIAGPTGAPGLYLADASPPSGGEPRRLTFFWPNEEDGATGGLYTVTVQVPNLQGTAWANATAAFDLGDGTVYPALAGAEPQQVGGDPGQAMPGPGLLLALAAIGLAFRGRPGRR